MAVECFNYRILIRSNSHRLTDTSGFSSFMNTVITVVSYCTVSLSFFVWYTVITDTHGSIPCRTRYNMVGVPATIQKRGPQI
jgi:hypothetical protein